MAAEKNRQNWRPPPPADPQDPGSLFEVLKQAPSKELSSHAHNATTDALVRQGSLLWRGHHLAAVGLAVFLLSS